MAFSFVAISIAALAGVEEQDAGLASGLIDTSQEIGGALGIAVLSTIAVTHTGDAAKGSASAPDAMTTGFHAAFWVGAAIAAAGVVASIVLVHREELEQAPALDAMPMPA